MSCKGRTVGSWGTLSMVRAPTVSCRMSTLEWVFCRRIALCWSCGLYSETVYPVLECCARRSHEGGKYDEAIRLVVQQTWTASTSWGIGAACSIVFTGHWEASIASYISHAWQVDASQMALSTISCSFSTVASAVPHIRCTLLRRSYVARHMQPIHASRVLCTFSTRHAFIDLLHR